MIKIGITGLMGSGKTSVCKILECLDIPVFYSDKEARKILETNKIVKGLIREEFGEDIYIKEKIDSKTLGSIVFNDTQKLEILNEIIRPVVFQTFEDFCKILEPSTKYVLFESALLNREEDLRLFDKIIIVESKVIVNIERVKKRDQLTNEEIKKRVRHQSFDILYSKKNVTPLYNGESKIALMEKTLALHKKLIQEQWK